MGRKKVGIEPKSAERLKQLMKDENISQTQLTKIIGISEVTLSGIAHGRKPLTEQTAKEIVKCFPKYTVEWFIGESDYKCKRDEQFLSIVNDQAKNTFFTLFLNTLGYKIERIEEYVKEYKTHIETTIREGFPEDAEEYIDSLPIVIADYNKDATYTIPCRSQQDFWDKLIFEMARYAKFLISEELQNGKITNEIPLQYDPRIEACKQYEKLDMDGHRSIITKYFNQSQNTNSIQKEKPFDGFEEGDL